MSARQFLVTLSASQMRLVASVTASDQSRMAAYMQSFVDATLTSYVLGGLHHHSSPAEYETKYLSKRVKRVLDHCQTSPDNKRRASIASLECEVVSRKWAFDAVSATDKKALATYFGYLADIDTFKEQQK